jgi:hypothetical protein
VCLKTLFSSLGTSDGLQRCSVETAAGNSRAIFHAVTMIGVKKNKEAIRPNLNESILVTRGNIDVKRKILSIYEMKQDEIS